MPLWALLMWSALFYLSGLITAPVVILFLIRRWLRG